MEEVLQTAGTLEDAKSALAERLTDVRGAGYVGLKSVAAYRSGLDLDVDESPTAERAFAEAKQTMETTGSYRLASRPLLGALLLVAFACAHEQGLPLQFHVGYGDSDVDMLRSNPLNLRPLLESHHFDGMKVVLLHECYPYTREGAYLAAIYGNVYLDLSYGIPFLGFSELLACTAAAVAVAPTSKLLYSSDGLGVPELHWSSAKQGRKVLEVVIRECVERGEMSEDQGLAAGQGILQSNARRLYELA
jgi:predicted TIM-barrel fold metal-dependent hydrolase